MSFPRRLGIALLAVTTFAVIQSSDLSEASAQVQEASRRDRLVFGLKARTPSEVLYLDQLSLAVDQGSVPADLVDGTFFWVRRHKMNTNFPFIYFERIMRLQAAKANITIPTYNGPYK